MAAVPLQAPGGPHGALCAPRELLPWETQLKDLSHRNRTSSDVCWVEMSCVYTQDNGSCHGHLGKSKCFFFFVCCGEQKWDRNTDGSARLKPKAIRRCFQWSCYTELCLLLVDPQRSGTFLLVWARRFRVPQSRSRPRSPGGGPRLVPRPQHGRNSNRRSATSRSRPPGAAPQRRPAARPAVPRRSAQGRAAAWFRLSPGFFRPQSYGGGGLLRGRRGGVGQRSGRRGGERWRARGSPASGLRRPGRAEPSLVRDGGLEGRRKEGNSSEAGWVCARVCACCVKQYFSGEWVVCWTAACEPSWAETACV